MRFEFTHADKILFPKDKLTKLDIAAYYEIVAKRMLPLMRDRPVSMKRYPNGIKGEWFFQKKISDYFPKWIKTALIGREGKEKIHMVLCNDLETLKYLVNQACITPHIWLSKQGSLDRPDRMIFDLDPAGQDFSSVIEAAHELREILEKKLKLKAFTMTTGSKGLHVVVPIKPTCKFDKVRAFAKSIAQLLVDKYPDKYTLNSRKAERKKKLFIDYLRNGYAQTGVAPYALRARDGAPIATPIYWEEVTSKLHPQQFNIYNIEQRLKEKDPWMGMTRYAKQLNLSGLTKKPILKKSRVRRFSKSRT